MRTERATDPPRGGWARARPWIAAAVTRGALVACAFWALVEGEPSAVAVGTVAVALATGTSLWLAPPLRTRIVAARLLQLAVFFVRRSVRGGLDVARRALSPRLDVAPAVVRIETRLAPGPAQTLFTSALSLLPGTLCLGAEGRWVTVHVLSGAEVNVRRELGELEARIAAALPDEVQGGDGDG